MTEKTRFERFENWYSNEENAIPLIIGILTVAGVAAGVGVATQGASIPAAIIVGSLTIQIVAVFFMMFHMFLLART